MSDSVTRAVTVPGEHGLHLVPCSLIARAATQYDCRIVIKNGDRVADAKNIFDLMSLSANHGTQLELEAVGAGAMEALSELVRLFESGFDGYTRRAAE